MQKRVRVYPRIFFIKLARKEWEFNGERVVLLPLKA